MIERIGKYEVRAELGRGGMGRVYQAYDSTLDHDVAIKVLTSEGDSDLLGRFRTEAGTTARLSHKNIVTVHTYGEQDGMPYLVMELLRGEDLSRVIKQKKPLTLLEKVRIMYQVAEGLCYAHQNSVIHRDIKPGNIMVLPDGAVKIMDFGIARVTTRDSTRRTQKGSLLGTISYMAPEQFRLALDADKLVDIFAYGDVFYELITGVHPFQAEDPGTVMYRITSVEPAPVRERAPACPEALAHIIHQLLAKDRELRYQNLQDALFDLEPVLFELRQERARQVLAEAPPLVEEGRLDAALVKVREALELEPMSREARQFRDQIQQELNRQIIRAKVGALLQEGDQMVAARRFPEAIQVFENALRLDKSATVQARLDQTRAELDKMRRAARLFGEARSELQKGDLSSALANISAAIELDPKHTEAVKFAEHLRQKLEAQERERRIQEAVAAAAEHARAGEFALALQVLDAVVEAQGQVPAIAETHRKVVALQAEVELKKRKKQSDDSAQAIRKDLESGNLIEARRGIDALLTDFSDLPDTVRHARVLRDELARLQQEADIAALERQVGELTAQGRFEDARSSVEPVRARYPGDRKIQLVLETVEKAQAARERADAIARATEHIQRLRQKGSVATALESARTAQNQYREHTPFRDIVVQLEAEVREEQRRAAIADAVRRSTSLLGKDPAQAVDLLQKSIASLGRDPELQRALANAEVAVEQRKEQQFVDEVVTRSEVLRSAGLWHKALDQVKRGLARYPNRIELNTAATEIRSELDRIARTEKVQSAMEAIEKALHARDGRTIEALLKAAHQDFPGHKRVEELEAEWARIQHLEALAAVENRVRESFSRDDLEDARCQLAEGAARFNSEEIWASLNAELESRGIYLAAIHQAQQLNEESRWAEAEGVLRTAVQIPIADPRAGQLLRAVIDKRSRAEREARERQEQERKAAEARERERQEQERKAAEARERERQEQERKAAEARERERQEQERKAAEARERERQEQERKAAEARERERQEQERKAAEARERERQEQERKAAEARERERQEQERKAAKARERERQEQERKAAEARKRERQEQERKAAEARKRERQEQERKAAEAGERQRQEKEERKRKQLQERKEAVRKRGPEPPQPGPAVPPHPAPAYTNATVILGGTEIERLADMQAQSPTASVDTKVETAVVPPPKLATPIYRKPSVIAPMVVAIAVAAFLVWRPAPAPAAFALQPAPAEISLRYQVGSGAPSSADINLGNVNVPFRARTTAKWLTVDPTHGNRLDVLHVNAITSGLKPDRYDASIEIVPADKAKYTLAHATIPVHLMVAPRGGVEFQLSVRATPVQFEYRDGGPVPSPKQIAISPDQMALVQTRWENPKQAGWARIERARGALKVSVHPYAGLSVGTHTATLLIELPGAENSPQRIPVSLKVSSGLGLNIQ